MRVVGITLILVAAVAGAPPGEAMPVAVRFPEGSVQGYLVLRGQRGEELGTGELRQAARDDGIHSRLVFRFKDGSRHDETVIFSQRKTFAMRQYRLIQRGPSFSTALEAFIDRQTGRYKVTARKDGEEEGDTFEGQLDLPPDVYNGMFVVLLKNLPKGETRTVHVVAFSPKPQVVEVELAPDGQAPFFIGESQRQASRYRLTPQLGFLEAIAASLLGKEVPQYRYWMLAGEAPAFLAFEGPLYSGGPTWRVELAAPRWPRESDKKGARQRSG